MIIDLMHDDDQKQFASDAHIIQIYTNIIKKEFEFACYNNKKKWTSKLLDRFENIKYISYVLLNSEKCPLR